MSINAFKDYLIEIGKFPLLKADEELELGRRIKEGDEEARAELINCNLRLVVYIAKAYKNNVLPIEELVAEGNIGLITAVDKYDYTRGFRFSTCATPWIKQSILKALTDKGRSIRLPAHVYQQLNQVRKFSEDFAATKGREPTKQELAKGLGLDETKVEQILQWRQDTISIDTPLGDEEKNTLNDILPDTGDLSPEDYANQGMMRDLVEDMISDLPERTQIIMKMRYGLGAEDDPADWQNEHTLEQIGDYLGITRERVRQIEKETLQTLKFNWEGCY